MERTAHTPPMLWIVGETVFDWSMPNCLRSCHSAPPSARYPSEGRKQQKLLETNFLLKKVMFDKLLPTIRFTFLEVHFTVRLIWHF